MKIIDFYTSLVRSLGMGPIVDKGDDILYYPDGEPVAFTYLKKARKVCLPTNRILQAGLEHNGEELHAFHPLCESMLSGESGTIRFLKMAIRMRLFQTATDLVSAIIRQGAENKPVKKSSYKRFLAKVCDGVKDPKFDDVLLASWTSVLAYITDPEKMTAKERVRLVISNNDTVDGEKYARVARYMHFATQETDDGTANYFGIRCRRKQDKAIIHRLLTTVFSWYPSEVGSNDNRANFASLARGWASYVNEYNQVASALHDVYADVEVLDPAWVNEVDNLDQYDKVIQTLPYNTGPTKEGEDRSNVDYNVKSVNVMDIVKPKTAAQLDGAAVTGEAEDPLKLFAARKPTPLSGLFGSAIDVRNLTPAQQAEWERTQRISDRGSIRSMSLAGALNQTVRQPEPSLLGGSVASMSLSSILSGGQQTLGGGGQMTLGQQTLGQASLGQSSFGQSTLGGGFNY